MKICCEGGPMTAGCHHDHCTGPRELAISGVGGEHDSEGFPDFIFVCNPGVNITAVYERKTVGKSGQ